MIDVSGAMKIDKLGIPEFKLDPSSSTQLTVPAVSVCGKINLLSMTICGAVCQNRVSVVWISNYTPH